MSRLTVAFAFANLQKLLTFFSKNTCDLDVVLTRTVNGLTTNKLLKLTMLWTAGPCLFSVCLQLFVISLSVCFISILLSYC